ncbi:MAG: carbohydrate ABC transporter substrate-binding protein [Clostridiales bacterium]|nr:carbohydrate ABC transporter substrate-binding protein [Clostridiales bacterium]
MKKVIASALSVAMVAAIAAGCTTTPTDAPVSTEGSGDETVATSEDVETSESAAETVGEETTIGTGPEVINLWTFTNEVIGMVNYYVANVNPEFGTKYTVKCTYINGAENYQPAVDAALVAGGDSAPDLYCAEADYILKYTQGDMSRFAATYKSLGIDVDKKISDAQIAQYTVDIGSRDGEVVALGYQATGGAMIYRASIAEEVFGSAEPADVEAVVGAGTGNWDKFWEAAAQLKEKGYSVVSGSGDMWNVCKNAGQPWIVDGELTIAPEREAFLDIAKKLKDEDLSNDAPGWDTAWYNDMMGIGDRGVFCFFGPAWLINYVMVRDGQKAEGEGTYGDWRVCTPPVGFFWGGTWLMGRDGTAHAEAVAEIIEWVTLDTSETGLQYLWANDLMGNGAKDTVASAVVMGKSDGTLAFCGGQNIFPTFIAGNANASGKGMTQYDATINTYFTDAANQYAEGNLDRDAAIETFKTNVADNLSF